MWPPHLQTSPKHAGLLHSSGLCFRASVKELSELLRGLDFEDGIKVYRELIKLSSHECDLQKELFHH